MPEQRTITVLEHELLPVLDPLALLPAGGASEAGQHFLTSVDVQALLTANQQRPGFCQVLPGGVKLAQYCGIIRLPSGVLEVLPKIGFDDDDAEGLARARGALLNMLCRANRLPITRMATVAQQAVTAPLLDVFIQSFLECALEQARYGLLSRYVPHADDLTVVKGQFQVHKQLRRNLARPQLLHCEFDEFTVDNPYNCAVRAALAACRGAITRTDTQRLWFEVQSRYAAAAPISMSAREVARLPRDRLTRRYGSLLTWCERLLEWSSPSLSAGNGQAPGLLFDMNKLFEAHVGALEEQHAGENRIVTRHAPQIMLASFDTGHAFQLKPDITVWHPATGGTPQRIDRIVDAKWKRLNPMAADCGVEESDLYQVLAYAMGYQCSRLELVYPASTTGLGGQTLRRFKVGANSTLSWSGGDVHVAIRTVSPWS